MATIAAAIVSALTANWTGAGATPLFLNSETTLYPTTINQEFIWVTGFSGKTKIMPKDMSRSNKRHVIQMIINTADSTDRELRLNVLIEEAEKVINTTGNVTGYSRVKVVDVDRSETRVDLHVYRATLTVELLETLVDSASSAGFAVGDVSIAGNLTVGGYLDVDSIISSTTLTFKPSGDTDDYLQMRTTGDRPHLEAVGGGIFDIETDGGLIRFYPTGAGAGKIIMDLSAEAHPALGVEGVGHLDIVSDDVNTMYLHFEDAAGKYTYMGRHKADDWGGIVDSDEIRLIPSGDMSDYFVFTTVANVPTLGCAGGGVLAIDEAIVVSGGITTNAGMIDSPAEITMVADASYIIIRADAAGEDIFFDAGGSFYFRDEDNARSTSVTIDSATGNISTIGDLSVAGNNITFATAAAYIGHWSANAQTLYVQNIGAGTTSLDVELDCRIGGDLTVAGGTIKNSLDNEGLYLGGGDDMRLYFDATNGHIVTAGDLYIDPAGYDVIIDGKVRVTTTIGIGTSAGVFEWIPSAAYAGGNDANFLYANFDATDPTAGGTVLCGLRVEMDGIDLTNSPTLYGIKLDMPATYGAGTEYAAQFTGDGKTVVICDDANALEVRGHGGTAGLIDIKPSAGGQQWVIKIDPAQTSGDFQFLRLEMDALNPSAAASVVGIEAVTTGLTSVGSDHTLYAYSALGNATATSYIAFRSMLTEATVDNVQTSFYTDLSAALTATALYRGLNVDFTCTRNGGAPALEGIRVDMPVDYSDFGSSWAARFTGDGYEVIICDTSTAITIQSGNMSLDSDSSRIYFGEDQDMNIYHSGTHGYVDNNTGNLYLSTPVTFQIDVQGTQLDLSTNFTIRDSDDGDAELFKLDTSARTLAVGNGADAMTSTFYDDVVVTGDLTVTGGNISSAATVNIKPSGDADDYLAISTDTHNVTLDGVDCDLIFDSDTAGAPITLSEIQDLLMFGAANASWVSCIFMMSNVSTGVAFSNHRIANLTATDQYWLFELPLPTTKGGLALHIGDAKLTLQDADGNTYVTAFNVVAVERSGNFDVINDLTNRTAAGDYTYTNAAADDVSAYDCVRVQVQVEASGGGAYDLDINAVLLECYYA